jgi:hypothetical protein
MKSMWCAVLLGFAEKRCFRSRSRTGVVVATDGSNLGLFMWDPVGGSLGPWVALVEPCPVAHLWPVFALFSPFFCPFSLVTRFRTDVVVFNCFMHTIFCSLFCSFSFLFLDLSFFVTIYIHFTTHAPWYEITT